RTYRPDLSGRRTQRDAQAVEGMMTVICVLEVERHEVWLLVAVRVVVVALVERDVTNSIPAVSGSVPGGSARVLEFLGVERGISVHSLQIDVPYVTGLTDVDRPPPLLPESSWAAAIVTVNECDPYRVVVMVLELERHADSLQFPSVRDPICGRSRAAAGRQALGQLVFGASRIGVVSSVIQRR